MDRKVFRASYMRAAPPVGLNVNQSCNTPIYCDLRSDRLIWWHPVRVRAIPHCFPQEPITNNMMDYQSCDSMDYKVWLMPFSGSGFRSPVSRVPGFRFWGSCLVSSRVSCSGLNQSGTVFRVPGSGFRVPGSGFGGSDFGFLVPVFGVWIEGFGYHGMRRSTKLPVLKLTCRVCGTNPSILARGNIFVKLTDLWENGDRLWEGCRGSRWYSGDTCPESYITKYTSIRRWHLPIVIYHQVYE